MAERAMFFTTTGSGNATAYTEANTIQFFKSLLIQDATFGVLRDYLNELAPTTSGGNILVDTGASMVNGYWYLNDTQKTVTVGTPIVGTTGYRVVLRLTHSADTIEAVLKSSSDGVASIPALQQDGTIWEESLCSFTKTTGGVVTLTDTRVFAQFATNHVKRDGDTISGTLDITGALNVDGAVDFDSTLDVAGTLTRAGNTVWDAANDGNNSGLDADLLKGMDIETIQRQGGSASSWGTSGTGNYSPSSARIQVGSNTVTFSSSIQASVSITFPVAFSNTPLVFPVVQQANDNYVVVGNVSSSGCTITCWSATSTSGTRVISWLAIGPV